MTETCENWLGLVNSYVYYVHQTREIYHVTLLLKDLLTSDMTIKLKRNLYVGPYRKSQK